MGFAPIDRTTVPVGMLHVPPTGLQTPRVTLPPVPVGEKGRFASATAGTVIVRVIFDGFTMLAAMLVSAINAPLTTTPTLVFCVGSVLGTNPVPVNETVKIEPESAVGRDAGLRPVAVAPGERTATLNVTTIVEAGLPHVRVTVPVKVFPGDA